MTKAGWVRLGWQFAVSIAACTSISVGQCASIQFSDDGTFSTERWSFFIFPDTGASGYSFSSSTADGQPSPSGSFVSSVDGVVGNRATLVAHFIAEEYDPQQNGAIESIDFSVDVINRGDSLTGQFSQYPRVSLLLDQDSQAFPFRGRPIPSAWQTLAWEGLTAYSFTFFGDPLPPPDFSASGAPLTFGFVLSFLISGDLPVEPVGTYATDLGIDNWTVTIHTVPSPAVGWLLVPAMILMSRIGRHRRA